MNISCTHLTTELQTLHFPSCMVNLSGLKFWKGVILEAAAVFLHQCMWGTQRMQHYVHLETAAPATSSSSCSLKVAFLIIVSVLRGSVVQSATATTGPPRARESIKIMTFPSSPV